MLSEGDAKSRREYIRDNVATPVVAAVIASVLTAVVTTLGTAWVAGVFERPAGSKN